MRAALILALTLVSCSSPPAPVAPPKDVTTEPWYVQAVGQLQTATRAAEESYGKGQSDDAAALIEKGEPIASQVLAVPHPTLGAMEAASDLDHLYGRMLLANRHYAWALFLFQKNLARWKYWKPSTPETERRLQQAKTAVAECEKGMAK